MAATNSAFRSTFEFTKSINWFPGHMTKGLRKIKETLGNVDLMIEILKNTHSMLGNDNIMFTDCRTPKSAKNVVQFLKGILFKFIELLFRTKDNRYGCWNAKCWEIFDDKYTKAYRN
ncbi:Mitochondrial ribosome-associated GTPase 1 [Smittium culicis]|uniref:Mitochondrial ribosome-associated GTPase 1 n=1 Tax=Smittium culicis TaxID=133412 RepID=A0A1R1Y602_9FUNG|nr:Mitochondrial ribosome-associated GTPase 1 [Smittium culicis]